jgi:hypothetical protein
MGDRAKPKGRPSMGGEASGCAPRPVKPVKTPETLADRARG